MTADSPYEIVINPEGTLQSSFREYLFNQPFYLRKQACEQVYIFYLLHKKSNRAYARFHLSVGDGKGTSPCLGTFGSVELNPQLPAGYLDEFIGYIDRFALKSGLRQIQIKSYPFCYAPEVSALLSACLLRQQYQLVYTDLNYHIPVTQHAFTHIIHHSEKRRLQKSIKKGLLFAEETKPDLPLIYRIIAESRIRKGYPVTMNFDDFRQLFDDFPGIYKIFSVRDEQKLAAVTVAVQINQNILYYFLPAHQAQYHTYSPMVLLIGGLYEYCQREGYTILDLGISTDKGVPNYGLMQFKQNVGALASLKLSFIKHLGQ
jgi:hypothetical protein